ncbi:MAG: MltA domain-containing protein [Pseudolabrys sp.]|nr:MltA domain-containing protein [Pseudolabrys sp.]
MAGRRSRCLVEFGFALSLLAAASAVAPAKAMKLRNAQVGPLQFSALNGWTQDDHAEAFGAFLKSCDAIRHGTKAMRRARPVYGALYRVCERAIAAGPLTRDQARAFFEDNFKPVRVMPGGQPEGFFTGYYETEVEGSRFPSDRYNVPLYRQPANLVMPKNGKGRPARLVGRKRVTPYYDRTEIENGILAGKDLEICWVKNPVDAFFAQIQGSTRVKLDTGKLLRLNYVAHNGLPYYPVGRDLIDRGIISKEAMSMDKIRDWMHANPEEATVLRRKSKSFVFFRETELAAHEEPDGAQGVPLTAGRSIAVDKSIHVYGTPVWIDAELPIASEAPETKFQRLMVAQDTGSAIIGPARADIYFGAGEEVGLVAGRIKQHGQFVMLVPQALAVKGTVESSAKSNSKSIPLPMSRPKGIVADALPAARP